MSTFLRLRFWANSITADSHHNNYWIIITVDKRSTFYLETGLWQRANSVYLVCSLIIKKKTCFSDLYSEILKQAVLHDVIKIIVCLCSTNFETFVLSESEDQINKRVLVIFPFIMPPYMDQVSLCKFSHQRESHGVDWMG